MAGREYTPQELQRMQQDAARRVRDMQRRARERLEGSAGRGAAPIQETVFHTAARGEEGIHVPELSPPIPPTQPRTGSNNAGGKSRSDTPWHSTEPHWLSGMEKADTDRLLLMILILLLENDGNCSPGLIAALFWIMAG